MREYLNDTKFLEEIDKLKIRVQYAKIILLDFATEKPIKEIQGRITQGTLNVNATSSVRRTITLTMVCNPELSKIENIDNEISINKKIRVEIGYDNPLKSYQKYGDKIWFPCGVFVLSSVTMNRSTSGWTLSITGKDKMVLLNGNIGGTFFGATTLSKKKYLPPSDTEPAQNEDVTMYDIVYETVNHFGEVPANRIIISDLDRQAAALVKYNGTSPIYLDEDLNMKIGSVDNNSGAIKYTTDDLIGYTYTEWTYPIDKELVANAGETVESVLNKIVQVLGNYEFYFDIDGNFIFKQQDNYSQTGSPLNELDPLDYVKSYSNTKYKYSLTNMDTVSSINKNPKYENIKNDFVAWGTRKVGEGDATVGIHYRLAIDEKPDIELANKYMWEWKKLIQEDPYEYEIHYLFEDKDVDAQTLVEHIKEQFGQEYLSNDKIKWKKIGNPCDEWREELYRRMLLTKSTDGGEDWYSSYDAELDSYWRDLYDTTVEEWDKTNHYNPDVIEHPENLRFWLDFIDPRSIAGQYAISAIGRRTVVQTQDKVNKLFSVDIPQILFVNQDKYDRDREAIDNYATMNGFSLCTVNDEFESMFTISPDNTTAFDMIRNMLYQYLTYQTQITIQCLPKYYLEPNNILYLVDKESGIAGNYIINSYSLPLSHNGTMSIQLTETYARL